MNIPEKYHPWIIAAIAALFFLPFLGGVHLFDWDEINFAEIAREMIQTGDYLRPYINYELFWQKPPMFIWMQVLSMKLVGVNDYAARLPNAICGIITLVVLYRIGSTVFNKRFGWLWAGAYLGSLLPFLYFKSGIIDPWFNLFIFLGLYNLILFYWKKENKGPEGIRPAWQYLLAAGFFIGLGIMTKGPVAYLLPVLTLGVYWIYQRFRLYINIPQFLVFTLIAFGTTGIWFGVETITNGPDFVYEFIVYQIRLFSTADAGHKGFPGYHFIVLLVGCFPASVFAIRAFWPLPEEAGFFCNDFRRWMKYLFWVVLILFSVVGTKIVHYSSLCYFPLTFLSALVLEKILSGQIAFLKWMSGLLWGIGGLLILVMIALPWLGMHPEWLIPLFKDPFAQGNLEAKVHWTGLEMLPGILLAIILTVAVRAFRSHQSWRGFSWLFAGNALIVFIALICYVKRVEGYSQRAAIEFFQSKASEDCYIITHGYKSFAHLYYARKRPVSNPDSWKREWLLTGPIDKDVYVSAKVHKAGELNGIPGLEEIYRKNGFVFFRRKAFR